jgi:hypothetical protein
MAISTIRETMVLRIVGHKFDKMGQRAYQNGQAGELTGQRMRGFHLTGLPIVTRQTGQYST